MPKTISVTINESIWLDLMKIQLSEVEKGKTKPSLSKIISDMVSEKLEAEKKASQS
jgi:hypothetical protein